jgi:cytochrome c oxidase subunit 2
VETTLPFFPEQASSMADNVDALYYFLLTVSAFFALLIATLVIYFAIKYRRRSESEQPHPVAGSLKLELAWTLIPLAIAMVMFFWGAGLFFALSRPPEGAIEIYAVGKQWMWKFQHLDGQSEINELHVPVGRPVRLTMASEDVIHSFFVPAFRTKSDVLPGRLTTAWFEATRPGRYHLFCAEYCGTKHSGMIGWVVAMEPVEYQTWLGGGAVTGSLADAGQRLFQQHACNTCHRSDSLARGPNLEGLFGKPVKLASGQTVIADETYLRESIVAPNAKLVEGFQPLMPTFQGLISEEGILQLIAYIKSLSKPPASSPGMDAAPAPVRGPEATPAAAEPRP